MSKGKYHYACENCSKGIKIGYLHCIKDGEKRYYYHTRCLPKPPIICLMPGCGKEIPHHRKEYCGDECVQKFRRSYSEPKTK